MDRKSNRILKIQLVDTVDSKAFKNWLRKNEYELVSFKNQSGRFIMFFNHPPKELFQWSDNFTILRGCTYLWYNGIPVSSNNYREVNWEELESVPPLLNEFLNK